VWRRHSHDDPKHIACLACGDTRVVTGIETGECPRCEYVGWIPVKDLDDYTRRAIMNGAFAHDRRPAVRC
jgi:hypothetical protein